MIPVMECRNLVKTYEGGKKRGIAGINLVLGRGRIIGLLGPNGSGKTTLIKMIAGLLTPDSGELFVNGMPIGPETKAVVSYLPEVTYLDKSMKVKDILTFFGEFYADFRKEKALDMLNRLGIDPQQQLKSMSKGTKEKVQLILVMSRDAQLYVLDEPIGGVDPAAREYILNTILTNYNPEASILISTHLITDVETILDDVVMIKDGRLAEVSSVDGIREKHGCSVNEMFREVFRC